MADHDVIAGRYRVDNILNDDIPGATTSTATDMILGRTVLVRLLPPGRPTLLDAARRAALVTDARLARVLDVGTMPDGRGYVINEQVAGTSLATMLQRGPVAPGLARSVLGETAAAVDVARRRGVHHLVLRPSVVHVASDGRVILTGLALDAALLDLHLADAEATGVDTEDLVRLLYAALTGRWPARPDDLVRLPLPDAPADGPGRWVPPRDLLPGADVPDALDRLCRTLGVGGGPVTPADVVQALEPWAQIKVQSASDAAAPRPPAARPPFDRQAADQSLTQKMPPPAPLPARPVQPAAPAEPAATMVYQAGPVQPPAPARPGPPAQPAAWSTPPVPDRPRPAPVAWAQDQPTPTPQSGPAWLAQFESQQARPGPYQPGGPQVAAPADPAPRVNAKRTYGRPSRSGQSGRFVLVGVAVVVLVVAVIGITAILSRPPGATPPAAVTTTAPADTPTATTTAPGPTPTQTHSPSGPTSGDPVIASVTTFNPSSGGGQEHEDTIRRIWDGNPATAWSTQSYTKPGFGQAAGKGGVAVIVTLAKPALVSTVTLTGDPTTVGGRVEIRQSDPGSKTGGDVLASGPVSGPTTFTLDSPQRMNSFVVWIAELPLASGNTYCGAATCYSLKISELEVG